MEALSMYTPSMKLRSIQVPSDGCKCTCPYQHIWLCLCLTNFMYVRTLGPVSISLYNKNHSVLKCPYHYALHRKDCITSGLLTVHNISQRHNLTSISLCTIKIESITLKIPPVDQLHVLLYICQEYVLCCTTDLFRLGLGHVKLYIDKFQLF